MWDVKEIFGMTYCRRRDLSSYDRRNGRVTEWDEVAFLARGKVGETGEDDRGSDTRWMLLGTLVDNVDDANLDGAIDEFCDQLKKDMRDAAAQLRAARDED
jgi:hypothetical protein